MEQNEKLNKEELKANYIYNKFLNLLMYKGKKYIARKLLNKSLKHAAKKLSIKDSSYILRKAIYTISPTIALHSKRVGNTVYQIPLLIDLKKSLNLGIRNLIKTARLRKETSMSIRLSNELVDAFYDKGVTAKKRDEIYKLGESNKSFAHFGKS